MRGIRGAISVEKNTRTAILENTSLLLKEMIANNKLSENDIISIFFTATDDLDEVYPAVAARQLGFADIPLLCYQEMKVKDSLEKCIRVLMFVDFDCALQEVKHVYLKKAKKLRPDLLNQENRLDKER
ncbi:chorismate mutase [Iocasia frigidifontis]|uniref:chorismate mutase n=1 Tax=Iocasia fonsfrigidae TaxID=2682810 RepID=A0A8A7K8U6_9FIRM|nr:chorismate mutase [Iocasia fonsfrigidae]QTL98223.1 chorismate mutase [Iocasia fonsfrigidae]